MIKTVATADGITDVIFKAKMHPIQFRLGLPADPTGIWGVLLLIGQVTKGKGKGREKGRGGRRGKEMEGKDVPPSPLAEA